MSSFFLLLTPVSCLNIFRPSSCHITLFACSRGRFTGRIRNRCGRKERPPVRRTKTGGRHEIRPLYAVVRVSQAKHLCADVYMRFYRRRSSEMFCVFVASVSVLGRHCWWIVDCKCVTAALGVPLWCCGFVFVKTLLVDHRLQLCDRGTWCVVVMLWCCDVMCCVLLFSEPQVMALYNLTTFTALP